MTGKAVDMAVLQKEQEFQNKRLDIMETECKEFKSTLTQLVTSINAIKWVAMGAGGLYLIQELGLTAVLKAAIL